MDAVRLINKALLDEDLQRILGGDAKTIRCFELGNFYDIDQLPPIVGSGQPYLNTIASTATVTPTASSQIVS